MATPSEVKSDHKVDWRQCDDLEDSARDPKAGAAKVLGRLIL